MEREEQVEDLRAFDKQRLEDFINRYYLNGEVNHVALNVEDGVLTSEFLSSDNSIVGNIELRGFPLEDAELGIYETENLKKILRVLEDDFDIEIVTGAGRPVSLRFIDDFKEAVFRLGELRIIPNVPDLKHVPKFQINMEFDEEFVDNFQKAAKALKQESNLFSVSTSPEGVEITVGYTSMGNTNQITLHPEVDSFTPFEKDNTVFYSDKFSEILSANSDVEGGTWEISQDGLSRIRFSGEDFDVLYYLVAKQD
jgi:hypothetical protein